MKSIFHDYLGLVMTDRDVSRGTLIGGGICSFRGLCPLLLPSFFGWHFDVGICKIQYRHVSSVSLCVNGWLFTGAVALITSRRELRRRSSFGKRAHSSPISVPLDVRLLKIRGAARLALRSMLSSERDLLQLDTSVNLGTSDSISPILLNVANMLDKIPLFMYLS